MRLIDADAFKTQIAGITIANNYPTSKANAICKLIDAQPTAYDPDKVVEQLSDKFRVVRTDEDLEWNRAMDEAITIVKGGGVDAK